ncbi:DUF6221 family protein [Streptomyces sp900116325]|uniref:DUF6221 family protein n=1 Tax=Streptomyces sp. 900116325 TaxID=3154295 RepID=UPI0033CD6905
MTDTLVQFLRARLDDDERTARGTTMPLDWHQGPGDDPEWTSAEMVLMWPPEFHTPYEQDKHWRGLTAEPAGLAAHIARHDPARVLAEVEAKRQLVKLHGRATLRAGGGAQYFATETVCRSCEPNHQFPERSWPCPTLRLLALPYADHPDYRPEWAPDQA